MCMNLERKMTKSSTYRKIFNLMSEAVCNAINFKNKQNSRKYASLRNYSLLFKFFIQGVRVVL